MFQFTGCPLLTLWIHVRIPAVFTGGFPHSEISGSQPVCGSPKLIAAYHVFHRLSVPRHPPCALLCLTFCTVHRMINHSVCCILIINNLAWLFMITIVCRSFDQRPIIALVNNNLIFCSDEQNRSCCFDVRISIDIPNGDKEIRTLDPLLARQVLSQLSYVPISPAETYALRRKMG